MLRCGGRLATLFVAAATTSFALGCTEPASSSVEAPSAAPSARDAGAPADAGPAGGDAGDPSRSPTSTIGSAVVVDLGAVGAGTTVTLEVPEGALGFQIVVESSGSVGIEKIQAPGGDVVHDAFTPKNGGFRTSEGAGGVAAAAVPMNDLASTTPLARGPWSITFGGAGSNGRARARLQTTSDGKFHGGALDLHVHVAAGMTMSDPSPNHIVDAANAGKDPDIVRRVDAFFSALKQGYDIDRGTVTFHAAPAALQIITSDAEIAAAAAISKGSPEEQALHVVLTNAIGSGADQAMGITPNIPGAAMAAGTPISALMIAHYDGVDAVTEALTMLHEMGHFAGLQHTSEYSGALFDPLSDTPECRGTRTASTKCPDDGNIMFTGSFPAAPTITAGQKAVFRGSPVYRAYASEAARASGTRAASASGAFELPRGSFAAGRRLCGRGAL